MSLIPAPVKTTDSRAAGFMDEHGDEVYELDAIDPGRLQEMIREAVEEHFDPGEFDEKKDLETKGRRRIQNLLTKSKVVEFLDQLKKAKDEESPEDETDDE